MQFRTRPRGLLAAATLILAASACGSDSTGPLPSAVDRVLLVGLPDTLNAGDIATFDVQVKARDGRDLHGLPVTLASTDPAVALIDPSAHVRTVAPGITTIRATVDGVAGTMRLVVKFGPATFDLRSYGGSTVPALIASGQVDDHGVVEFREAYLERGTLQLGGGAQPTYDILLHYASYAVTTDDAGQRHLEPRASIDMTEHGSVQYDARGDLAMVADLTETPSHTASAAAGGFTVQYFLPDPGNSNGLFFERAP